MNIYCNLWLPRKNYRRDIFFSQHFICSFLQLCLTFHVSVYGFIKVHNILPLFSVIFIFSVGCQFLDFKRKSFRVRNIIFKVFKITIYLLLINSSGIIGGPGRVSGSGETRSPYTSNTSRRGAYHRYGSKGYGKIILMRS